MSKSVYVPDAGDVVSLELGLQDQGFGYVRKPSALVISPASYNAKTGLMVCCPITTKIRRYPFEVVTEVNGLMCAILSDQIKTLDWNARFVKKVSVASALLMAHVRAKMKALLLIL
ncbi:MAG: type II toxin-antitoxin system PemK/MazF family toxin [Gallionella sp.]|nr:type II toxin-antitoxin system PemK/MazF family toxin [Gallionella sp.]